MNGLILRLGTVLARAARRMPGFISRLSVKLRASGAAIAENARIADITKWAAENPAKFGIIITALFELGVRAGEWMFEGDADTPTLTKPEIDFVHAAETAVQSASSEAIERVAAASELLRSPSLDDPNLDTATETLKLVLRWAVNHYGDRKAAVEAHRMNQAFFEIPAAQVAWGFKNLDLSQAR